MRCHSLVFLIVLAGSAPFSTWGATPSPTPEILHGTGLHWGMIPSEVEQTLNAKIVHGAPKMFDEYSIPSADFDGLVANYVLGFYSAGKLSSVFVTITRPDGGDEQARFEDLRSRLIQWYGKPAGDLNRDNGNVVYTFWITSEN